MTTWNPTGNTTPAGSQAQKRVMGKDALASDLNQNNDLPSPQQGAQTLDVGKLNIGDKVRVVRKVTAAPGWEDDWVDRMDLCVGDGVVQEVTDLRLGGYLLEPSFWNFPAEALELVERAPEDPVEPDWKARAEAAEAKLSAAEARADALAESLGAFIGCVLVARIENTPEYMAGLAEDINKAAEAIGETDRVEFNGEHFVIRQALGARDSSNKGEER